MIDMNHSPSHGTTLDDLLRDAYPDTAGVTLAAMDVLAGLEVFNRAQVAYLVGLAFAAGMEARSAADAAEMVALGREHYAPEATRETRVARRLAEMAAGAERHARRPAAWKPVTPGAPVLMARSSRWRREGARIVWADPDPGVTEVPAYEPEPWPEVREPGEALGDYAARTGLEVIA